jgi:periplasmic divalent cation tolerance protein
MSKYCIIMSTTDSLDEANALARFAVESKLAACVQRKTVTSTFFWDGKIDESEEFLMLFKTTESAAEELKAAIAERHSYDVPEILEIPITSGHAPYLDWMDENTK